MNSPSTHYTFQQQHQILWAPCRTSNTSHRRYGVPMDHPFGETSPRYQHRCGISNQGFEPHQSPPL